MLTAIALAGVGCEQGFASGAWAEVSVTEASLTRGEDGQGTLQVDVLVGLTAFEADDVLALDAVTVSMANERGFYDDLAADRVEVDAEDWPVELAPFEREERRLRASATVALPPVPEGPCPTEVSAGVSIELLVVGGRTRASAPLTIELPGGPSRLGIARSGGDVATVSFLDPWTTQLLSTVDGRGDVWVVEGTPDESRVWTRTPSGAATSDPVDDGLVTMAPWDEGGIVLVESRALGAHISRLDAPGRAVWSLEIEPTSPSAALGWPIPIATHGDRVVVALPAGSRVADRPELGPELDVGEPWLLEVRRDGALVSATPTEAGVVALAFAGDVLVLRTLDAAIGQRDGEELWRASLPASDLYGAWPALAALGADDFVTTSAAGLTRRSARDGSERWTAAGTAGWAPASLAVVGDQEILVSAGGWGARISAAGERRFEGAISCGGLVAFGGANGRAAWASIGGGLEGWGDAPDRDVPLGTLSMGEVAP